jgi:hypothetical protein
MTQDDTAQVPESIVNPFNVVLGGAGMGLLLAAAGFAFLRSQKHATSDLTSKLKPPSIGKFGMPNKRGKWALLATIRVIEHDTSRKLLLGLLKAMAKRAD